MFGELYTFGSFLALSCTHLISEAPHLNSTFVFMLVVMSPSLVAWWCAGGVFCVGECELLTYYVW